MSDNEDFVQGLANCREKMLQTALFVLCAMFTLCMVGGSQRMSASCGWGHGHIGAERINALFRASSIPVLAMSTKALSIAEHKIG